MISFFKNIFWKKKLTKRIERNINSVVPADEVLSNQGNWLSVKIMVWKAEGVKINTPATEEMITKTEKELSFQFPKDFIDFYKKANGFVEWDFIGNMFSIWSLEKIVNEFRSSDDKNFIPFCDHCI